MVVQIAHPRTKGAWYRGRRLVGIDGSTWDVADTPENAGEFSRPGVAGAPPAFLNRGGDPRVPPEASHGKSAYPQLRFVTLVESGTHVLFGAEVGDYGTGEATLARSVIKHLKPDMLCLADRGYVGFEMWCQAAETGAALLWRMRRNQVLPCLERLADGSYLSKLHATEKDRRHDRPTSPRGRLVRVVEYRLKGIEGAEELYRLVTTLTDPDGAPAAELAALYHERWEIETAIGEVKTHLKGRNTVLRSRTPVLVRQELFGFRFDVKRLWLQFLCGRSQNDRTIWAKFGRLAERWLPPVRITHPWPSLRFFVKHPRQEPGALAAHAGICAGGAG